MRSLSLSRLGLRTGANFGMVLDGREKSVFEYLASFSKIIVSGPQRSGTTLAAAAAASDLDYYFYPEEQIRVHELWRVKRLFGRTSEFVLQAPAICRYVHQFSEPDVAIVLVRRDIKDILASENRVEWTGQEHELKRYGLKEGTISEVKYQYWDEHQKDVIHNPFEIEYESLVEHPMWITKEERTEFGPRQYGHTKSCGG